MKNIINIDDFTKNIDLYIPKALNWNIFVYPTDTVYWIWCVVNKNCIQKIYEIKKRSLSKNLSIIAPSIEWIKNSFEVNNDFGKQLNNYLNKYHWITLLLKKKEWIKSLDLVSNNEFVWVRILKHDFQKFVTKLWQPFITTSANISGNSSINKLELLDTSIQNNTNIDYFIDWWELFWKPSVIIDLTTWNQIFRDK